MTDGSWAAVPLDILHRERRSLLQFANDVFPWASVREEPAMARLRRMIDEEQRAAIRLATVLQRRHISLPPSPPYPLGYASLQFVSLDYLIPHLIDHERVRMSQLERDLTRITDADASQEVQAILAMKKRHLAELEELRNQQSKPVHA